MISRSIDCFDKASFSSSLHNLSSKLTEEFQTTCSSLIEVLENGSNYSTVEIAILNFHQKQKFGTGNNSRGFLTKKMP